MTDTKTSTIRRGRVLAEVRKGATELEQAALDVKLAGQRYAELSSTLKPKVLEVDGENGNGVRFDGLQGERAVMYIQPTPGKEWDAPRLIEELKRRGVWAKVSTTSLDTHKLAAEIAAGNLPAFEEFQTELEPRGASLRFVNAKPDSL
jgi:hypothetical protein